MLGRVNSYRELKVWQEAMAIARNCYSLTAQFPKEELFGLTSQVRRSAASIAANIAEGHGRENTGSFIQFLRVAQGSLKELETHLMLAEQVKVCAVAGAQPILVQCESLGKMLRSLIRALQAKKSQSDGDSGDE
jgi:four helix bundle protein